MVWGTKEHSECVIDAYTEFLYHLSIWSKSFLSAKNRFDRN